MKIVRKLFFTIFFTVMVVLLAGIISAYLYEEEIIRHMVRKANKYVNTPVHVEQVNLDLWSDFPRVSVSFKDVVVEENTPARGTLATADEMLFSLNVIDIVRNRYDIRQLWIKNGNVKLKIDKDGNPNYHILKKTEGEQEGVDFKLDKIRLDEVALTWKNDQKEHHFDLFFEKTEASLLFINDYYDIDIEGNVTSRRIQKARDSFLTNKKYDIAASLFYNTKDKSLEIRPSTLGFNQAEFNITGNINLADENHTELNFEGTQTDIQTLISFLPDRLQNKLKAYKSKGEVYFKGTLEGPGSSPAVRISFGIHNGTIYHPGYKSKLENATFKGMFFNPSITDKRNTELRLTDIEGVLDGKKIQGDFFIKNLLSYYLDFNLTGSLDFKSFLNFYPVEEIKKASGLIGFNVDFKGNVNDLKRKTTTHKVNISGELNLQDVYIDWKPKRLPLSETTGNLLFNNNDLAINDVTGKLGSSDFKLNGFFKNIITYLLLEGQPIGIEADLQSNYLDLDELLTGTYQASEKNKPYKFHISPELFLTFNCDIDFLKLRRFRATNIRSELKVKDQLAVARSLKANTLGGHVEIGGIVNARQKNDIHVDASGILNGIYIDSLFYVFENFRQNWLIDDNLEGKVFADIITEMSFNENLNFNSQDFIADISIAIEDGELNNFQPMRKLAKYVPDEDLKNLKFSQIKNDIHIEDQTIFLPEMEVSSNVTSIKISGTHTFSQNIDYRVMVPLRVKPKFDKDEYFGAVENDGSGKSNLFFKIIGTTKNYEISYDTDAVKQKIIADLKKEVLELKEAFKNKGKGKKEVLELSEDDYFEWDDN